jgi:hypothetical protein
LALVVMVALQQVCQKVTPAQLVELQVLQVFLELVVQEVQLKILGQETAALVVPVAAAVVAAAGPAAVAPERVAQAALVALVVQMDLLVPLGEQVQDLVLLALLLLLVVQQLLFLILLFMVLAVAAVAVAEQMLPLHAVQVALVELVV